MRDLNPQRAYMNGKLKSNINIAIILTKLYSALTFDNRSLKSINSLLSDIEIIILMSFLL
jgi:hypothetical protein